MEEFKGTPGPWFFDYSKANDAYEIAPMRPGGTCMDWDREVCITAGNSIENAALIAAAPDLLAALQDFMYASSGNTQSCGHDFECICRFDKAKAAIAKALGK